MSGTDIGYPKTMSGTNMSYCHMRCPPLPPVPPYAYAMRCPVPPYAYAMRCPVLTRLLRRYPGSCLRVCYAMSGTDIAYAAIGLCVCYAMPGTHIAYAATSLRHSFYRYLRFQTWYLPLSGYGSYAYVRLTSVPVVLNRGTKCARTAVPGPTKKGPNPPLELRAITDAFAKRSLCLANLGYIGHMWELYAMWTWIGVFFEASFPVIAPSFPVIAPRVGTGAVVRNAATTARL
eukprot:3191361-Rhodomonas_salina.3